MLSTLLGFALLFPFCTAMGLLLCAYLLKCIYRLFMSPLSRFPGPRFAACSKLFEAYHVLLKNDWLETLQRLHRQHGPVVRIGPNELHFSDHKFCLQFHGRHDLHKCPNYYGLLDYISGGLAAPQAHKERKSKIQPLFTGRTLSEFSDSTLNELIDSLLDRLALEAKDNDVVNITHVIWAYTNDIMVSYILGTGLGGLESNDLKSPHDAMRAFSAIDLATMLRSMWPIKKLFDIFPSLRNHSVLGWIDALVGKNLKAIMKGDPEYGKERQTVLARLWSRLPDERSTTHELSQALFIGGESLLSNTTFFLYHMMQNPRCVKKLRHELDKFEGDISSHRVWHDAKVLKLNYLDALCRESTRLSSPGWHRQPRTVPEPINYEGALIPPMTSISFTLHMLERDPILYSDPLTFNPDRWLGDDPETLHAKRSSVTFGTGTRTCLGQFIARHVLVKTMAALVHKFDISFADKEADEKGGYRYLDTYPKKGHEGYLRVKLVPRIIA